MIEERWLSRLWLGGMCELVAELKELVGVCDGFGQGVRRGMSQVEILGAGYVVMLCRH